MSSAKQPDRTETDEESHLIKQKHQLDSPDHQSPDHQSSDHQPCNQQQCSNQPTLSNHFVHSKSLIQRRPHDAFNQQLYRHHRLHHHKLNQKCTHHYQCVVYANLIRNQQFKKDQKKKKNKRKYSKRVKRRKKRTFTKDPPVSRQQAWLRIN